MGESPLGLKPSPLEVRRLVVGLFAGCAAELRLDPEREKEARATAASDDHEAEVFLQSLYPDERKREVHRRALRGKAASVVEEHWDAVAALASELLELQTLESEEAALIVAVAEGERAKRELAELRRNIGRPQSVDRRTRRDVPRARGSKAR